MVLAHSSRSKFHTKIDCAYKELFTEVKKTDDFHLEEHGIKVGSTKKNISDYIYLFEVDSPEVVRPKLQELFKTELFQKFVSEILIEIENYY